LFSNQEKGPEFIRLYYARFDHDQGSGSEDNTADSEDDVQAGDDQVGVYFFLMSTS